MNEIITGQMKELEGRRKDRLEKVKALSDRIRKIAEEIERTKKSQGLATLDDERVIEKRIERIDFKISTTKNMPLKVERELAGKIGDLEKKLKKVREARASSNSLKEMENQIKDLKKERESLKNSLDKDAAELEEMKDDAKREGRKNVKDAAIEQFTLGDIAITKHKKDSEE